MDGPRYTKHYVTYNIQKKSQKLLLPAILTIIVIMDTVMTIVVLDDISLDLHAKKNTEF